MSGEKKILVRVEDGVGSIVINNPARRNAISLAMWQGLAAAARQLAAVETVRMMRVRGAGGVAFAAGADISEFDDNRDSCEAVAAYDDAVGAACAEIAGLGVPTVAVIEGFCIGGGLALALSCDLRLAAADARLAIPAARLGVAYGFDLMRKLTEVVGPARAKDILFTARMIDADEAHGMGLVSQVAGEDGLEALVERYTKSLTENAPLTLAAVKRAVDEAIKDPGARVMAGVATPEEACVASEDYVEGRQAFQVGRAPQFKGQ